MTAAATSVAPDSERHVVSDVSLFVEELNLPQEDAEEMDAVSNTFRGVENLGGASNWEGLYYQSSKVQQQALKWKRVSPIEVRKPPTLKISLLGFVDHPSYTK